MKNKFTEKQEQWLQLLESGKHQQCRNTLFNGKAYCCLGVLERFVCGAEPIYANGSWYLSGTSAVAEDYNEVLLLECAGAIRFAHGDAFYKAIREAGYDGAIAYTRLARYNDTGATFAQIAAAIRAVPWAVFSNFEAPACQETPAAVV